MANGAEPASRGGALSSKVKLDVGGVIQTAAASRQTLDTVLDHDENRARVFRGLEAFVVDGQWE
jgi:hypothetical protein